MNTYFYEKLKSHIQQYRYSKGAYKGEAPGDQRRRRRTKFRVADRGDFIAVVFWYTDIIKAYPEGTITVDLGGYPASPTTREAFRAWGRHAGFDVTTVWGPGRVKNTAITTPKGKFAYYRGITFDGDGDIMSHRKSFQGCVADRGARKALNDVVKAAGTKDLFATVWSSSPVGVPTEYARLAYDERDLLDPERVAAAAVRLRARNEHSTANAAWREFAAVVTNRMCKWVNFL